MHVVLCAARQVGMAVETLVGLPPLASHLASTVKQQQGIICLGTPTVQCIEYEPYSSIFRDHWCALHTQQRFTRSTLLRPRLPDGVMQAGVLRL